ncbi:MAG: hypothetical protein NTX04_05425, partial [Verrucomicrobia bacterium]|nr:hypothetical protein [Verrucomicrobiota bacterium]
APVVPVPVPTPAPTPPPTPPVEVAKKALPTIYFFKENADLAVELANFAPNGEAGNFQKIEGLVGALGLNPAVGGGGNGDDHSTHPQLYKNLQDALKKIAAQKEAEGLIALLKVKGEAAPTPEGKTGKAAYDWFEEKQKAAKAFDPAFPSKADLERLLNDWKTVDSKADLPSDFGQRATKHLWPRWLSKRYEERGKGGGSLVVTAPVVPVPVPTPTPPPTPPVEVAKKALPTIYFFKENADLAVKIPDGDGLTIWLRTGGLGQAESEMKAFSTTMKLGPGGDYFDKTGGNLKMAIKPPTPPYRLVIRQKEEERARIFVGAPLGADEVLEKLGVELRLTAEGKIAGTLPKLAAKEGEELVWVVKYSGKALGGVNDGEFKVGPDGQCDLEAVRKEIQGMVAAKEKEKAPLEANKVSPGATPSQQFIVTPQNVGEEAINLGKTQFPNKPKQQITQAKGPKEAPTTSVMPSELEKLGENLKNSNLDNVHGCVDNLKKEVIRLQATYKDGEREKGLKNLYTHCTALLNFQSKDIDASKAASAKKTFDEANNTKINDEITKLKSFSLMKDNRLPAGDYPLCIKPPQSWSTSGWGLVPVKTLKLP